MTLPHTLPSPAGRLPDPAVWGRLILLIIALCLPALAAQATGAQSAKADSIIVQSTTSTQNAGFYNHVVPPLSYTRHSDIPAPYPYA